MNKINHNSKYCLYCVTIIFLTIIFFSISVYAGNFAGLINHDLLQKSSIKRDRVVIKNKNFKTQGYLQPSVIDPRKTILYDTDGNPQGYFQKDVIDNRKVRFHQTGKGKQD